MRDLPHGHRPTSRSDRYPARLRAASALPVRPQPGWPGRSRPGTASHALPITPILGRPWRRGHRPARRIPAPGQPGSSWNVATGGTGPPSSMRRLPDAVSTGGRSPWRSSSPSACMSRCPHGTGYPDGWSRSSCSCCWPCSLPRTRAALAGRERGCGSSPASSSRCAGRLYVLPETSCPPPSTPGRGPRPYLGPFPRPRRTRRLGRNKGPRVAHCPGSCRLQLSEDSGALSPGEPGIPPSAPSTLGGNRRGKNSRPEH